MIIIKDIDDGLNFAFPDPEGSFERVFNICEADERSGYRKSGRQIFTFLNKLQLKNIKLEKAGLNTIGMDFNERSALFNIYFPFILEDLEILVDKYPNYAQLREDLEWYSENFNNIEEKFHESDFIFNLGMMLFTANA